LIADLGEITCYGVIVVSRRIVAVERGVYSGLNGDSRSLLLKGD
jgi:hypothetical protein